MSTSARSAAQGGERHRAAQGGERSPTAEPVEAPYASATVERPTAAQGGERPTTAQAVEGPATARRRRRAAEESGEQATSGQSGRQHRPYARRMAGEQRREQLLDAALGVIVREGYARTSIEAVARAAGVTRPVVYDHFRDLGQLLHALIEREERCSLAQLAHITPDDPAQMHPAEVLTSTVRRFLDAVLSRPDTWTLILLPPDGTPAIVREHVETNRAEMVARMEGVVRWAVERSQGVRTGVQAQSPEARTRGGGQGADQLDVELAARALLGLAEDAGRMALTDRERYAPERYERFVHSIMKLLWPT